MVADTQFRPAPGAANAHFDGRRPVAPGVLQEVPDHPAEQARVAAHGNGLALELDGLVTCAFLAREREQINLFIYVQSLHYLQATGQQDLVDQCIELSDVEFEVMLT